MPDWLLDLFSSADWRPRGACGKWSPLHFMLYTGAHFFTALAFFVNPIVLVWLYRTSRNARTLLAPWRSFLLPWALFTAFCGVGHVLEGIVSFWWPAYRFFTVWTWLTAVVSWLPTIALPMKVAVMVGDDRSRDSQGDRHKDGAGR